MHAADIMMKQVVVVSPETPLLDVANKMLSHRISAVPVLEGASLVGIVSEGDLLRRSEIGTVKHRSWWLELFASNQQLADEYARSHGKTAKSVMTSGVVTVAEDTPVDEIARIFEERHIKRVPVMRGDRLVGIVSRANLIAALAASRELAGRQPSSSDRQVRDALFGELQRQRWASLSSLRILVRNGVVNVSGVVRSTEEKKAIRAAAESISGVREVHDHTVVEIPLPPM